MKILSYKKENSENENLYTKGRRYVTIEFDNLYKEHQNKNVHRNNLQSDELRSSTLVQKPK